MRLIDAEILGLLYWRENEATTILHALFVLFVQFTLCSTQVLYSIMNFFFFNAINIAST